uniref:AmmeMemoRadiSam system radical SAM enzyme n=1 Tax=candidate division WOR-3 bacterium TaxID=2052148 RepID=A0A7C3YRX9_UNCW3
MREAMFYSSLKNNIVQCELCPHFCKLKLGEKGFCMGRKNIDGKLYAINYGESVSISIDPIEKKPLFHFYPGSRIFSIATYGCNLRCPFCQNYTISQFEQETEYISPTELYKIVKNYGLSGISFTYTEPFIWYEFIYDFCKISNGDLKIVLVTNGMINEKPLLEILPFIDAMNIDLKSMNPDYYRKVLKGDLETVKRTIEISQKKALVEVTNLLVTGDNDSDEDIEKLIDYIASVNVNIPLHFSRYFPNYKYTKSETPIERLIFAYNKARKKLNYVYLGNVLIEDAENTYCPECGTLLVERYLYRIRIKNIEEKKCKVCGRKVDIIL